MISTAVTAMRTTKNDLPDRTRAEMIDLLNCRLADSLDLGLQARHARWNVRGSQFIALHALFERLYTDVDRYADLLAERTVQLWGLADGTVRSVENRSSLPVHPAAIEGSQHVSYIVSSGTASTGH